MDIKASGIEPGQSRLNGPQTTGPDYRNLSQPTYVMVEDDDVPVAMRGRCHVACRCASTHATWSLSWLGRCFSVPASNPAADTGAGSTHGTLIFIQIVCIVDITATSDTPRSVRAKSGLPQPGRPLG